MVETSIPIQELIDAYTQSLGIEGAQKLIQDAIKEAGLPTKSAFSKEEAIKICEVLKTKKGFVGIIALALASRIHLK